MRADPKASWLPGAAWPAADSRKSTDEASAWQRQKASAGPKAQWLREMERAQLDAWFKPSLLLARAMPVQNPSGPVTAPAGMQVAQQAAIKQALGAYTGSANAAAPRADHWGTDNRVQGPDGAAASADMTGPQSKAPESAAPQASESSDKAGGQDRIGMAGGTAKKAGPQDAGARQLPASPIERAMAGLVSAPVAPPARPEIPPGGKNATLLDAARCDAPLVGSIHSTPVAPAPGLLPSVPVCFDDAGNVQEAPEGRQASARSKTSGASNPGRWVQEFTGSPQVGVYCENVSAGLSVWLAVPAGSQGVLAQISLIASGLQRLLGTRGERLVRVVCNGVPVWQAVRQEGAARLSSLPKSAVTSYASGGLSVLAVAVASQDGHAPSALTKISFDEAGFLVLTYANAETSKGIRLALSRFDSLDSVEAAGGNEFKAIGNDSWESGHATVGSFGKIQSGVMEISNVDLSREFGDLVIMQRGYQASSQIVSTANEMLQQLFAMRSK